MKLKGIIPFPVVQTKSKGAVVLVMKLKRIGKTKTLSSTCLTRRQKTKHIFQIARYAFAHTTPFYTAHCNLSGMTSFL